MKRKVLLLALPILVLLATVSTVVALEAGDPPAWQEALDDYVARQSAAGSAVQVVDVARARLPWHFRREMGAAVSNPEDWRWDVRQLPYPPDALVCVRATRTVSRPAASGAAEPVEEVLYVGRHSDRLWRVGWLVHQGPPFDSVAGPGGDLAAVGCDLSGPKESVPNKTE